MKIERDLAGRGTDGIPAAIRTGGLIFVDTCEGGEGDVATQCRRAYATMVDRLSRCGVGAENVARLDHYTESQDWLAERQVIRAGYFGRPAAVASTGVAVRHNPPNQLSVAGIAVQDVTTKQLRVAGETYGMSAIASAVDVGDLVFISGILNDGGRATVEDSANEFSRQARGCFLTIGSILAQLDLTPANVVRQDIYIGESCSYEDLSGLLEVDDVFSSRAGRSGAKLPFDGCDLIEVTTIASKHGALVSEAPTTTTLGATVRTSRFHFTDACGDNVDAAVDNLVKRMEIAGISLDTLVRVDVCCSDREELARVRSAVSSSFAGVEPVVIAYRGQPLSGKATGISAIAAHAESST